MVQLPSLILVCSYSSKLTDLVQQGVGVAVEVLKKV